MLRYVIAVYLITLSPKVRLAGMGEGGGGGGGDGYARVEEMALSGMCMCREAK